MSMNKIKLGYIAEIYNGNSINAEVKADKYSQKRDGRNYIATKDIDFDSTVNYNTGVIIPFTETSFKTAPAGCVFVCSEGGSAGKKTAYITQEVCFGNKLYAIVNINNQFFGKYVFYYTRYREFYEQFSGLMNGIIGGVSSKKFGEIEIPLPPLPEQHRIVVKIDSLFSELDNGVALLKTTKSQLAIYRQAVLQWAFEGKLINGNWKFGILENIVSEIKIGPFGTLLHKADYIDNGIPIVNPKHMNNQKIIYDSHTTISKKKANELSTYKLQENDILLARRGEMGRTAPVTEKENGWLCGTGSMIIRLKEGNLNGLYSLFLSSEQVRKYLTDNCKGTTMDNLNETIVKKIPVPICPKSDQLAIVSAIESRLSVCDKLEQTIDQTLAFSASLRQSILKKAFEGRLVPQDPNDEPAEKLLERIKAEKAAVLAKQKQTRKPPPSERKRAKVPLRKRGRK